MTKSYVAMGDEICPVCGVTHSTSVVLDKRMRNVFEEGKHVVVGLDLCPEHKKLHEDGYLALVEIDPTKSNPPYKPENTFRTGNVAHIRREIAPKIFKDIPKEHYEGIMVYVEPGVIDQLAANMPPEAKEER